MNAQPSSAPWGDQIRRVVRAHVAASHARAVARAADYAARGIILPASALPGAVAPQVDEDFVPMVPAAEPKPAEEKKARARQEKAPRLPHTPAEDDRRISDPALAYELVTGGRAKITFKSLVSGRHYTYQVNRKPPRGEVRKAWDRRADDRLFVSVRTSKGYDYMGMCKTIRWPLHVTDDSLRRESDTDFRAFQHVWTRLIEGRIPSNVAVYFEDHCISCGKVLTNPDSVQRWMGKDCAKRALTCAPARQPKAAGQPAAAPGTAARR